jgi:CRP-like cAMP-binding protein
MNRMSLSREEVLSSLLHARPFAGLGPGELAGLIGVGFVERFEAHDPIYTLGEPATRGYVLLSGRVELRARIAPGRTLANQIYTSGSMFGHEGLIKPWPRAESCEAVEESFVLTLSGEPFRELLEAADPGACRLVDELLGHLVHAVKDANERFQDLHTRPDRTLELLRRLAAQG